MNRIGLPSGVSEMEHLQHSFADHTRQGGFLKSLSDQPHKGRPADSRKPGVSFRRQRNKLLSRVKLRLRYRLSFLASIRNTQSKSANAALALGVHAKRIALDPSHAIQLLELYAVVAAIVLTLFTLA